jgi:ribosomal protein S21
VKVAVKNHDLLDAIKRLKKKRQREGIEHLEKLRAIPKPSERKKAKQRTAVARLRNQIKREGSRNDGHERRYYRER